MSTDFRNHSSIFVEAINVELERAMNSFLKKLVEQRGYHFIGKNALKKMEGTPKKLLIYDGNNNAYDIGAVIADISLQPIILIESEYTQDYNRNKGSWVCTAHSALRRRYGSIRSSIAVLAGNWSSSSVAMMKSYDINIFLIPFKRICDLLAGYSIEFDWDEKDRVTAIESWNKYAALSNEQKSNIGLEMVNFIKSDLEQLVLRILDDTVEREIDKILIELRSNLGEVKEYEFFSVEEAIEFLNATELKQAFITTDSLTLFDPPPYFNDI
ncbi:MAG: hypothetical protein DPW09_42445 [Anaerolineae bacterium]|nr:hypothetical protein [Anaerolineales bacterium]MCQ3980123.1 hypothetical protein [Anaerolineae bacterium]